MAKLSTAQAAHRLGVTDRSVLNYISRGLLKATRGKVGLKDRYEIDAQDLESFAASQDIPLKPLEQ